MPRRIIDEYQVGWICAVSMEMTAAQAMLDEEHEPLKTRDARDCNSYVLGRVSNHNVVIACLPMGICGTNAAATIATNMCRTFKNIQFGLMVGVGAGIPNLDKDIDIRLGDVVVSKPETTHGGVVQFDRGKHCKTGTFQRTGCLAPPPTRLLTALSTIQSIHDLRGSQVGEHLATMYQRYPRLLRLSYGCPGPEQDDLHCSHGKGPMHGDHCIRCHDGKLKRKPREPDQGPVIHYGTIASGNASINNAVERDLLEANLGAMCIETEAAGLMNDFPCLVIRGICDYADAHASDVWQKYAATTAAAFAKELLSVIHPTDATVTPTPTDLMKYNLDVKVLNARDMGRKLSDKRGERYHDSNVILQPQATSQDTTQRALVLEV